MTLRPRLRLEALESRRAPATLTADGKSVAFQDIDGDSATVTFSRPVPAAVPIDTVLVFDNGFRPGDNSVAQLLQRIDLTGLPDGMSVSVKATTITADGRVDVGWVNATGKDVGTVNISGDLGRVTAGNANTKTPGLLALTAGSIGLRDLTTQEPGGSRVSDVNGAISSLKVAGAVDGVLVRATGGVDGKIGRVQIGADLVADPAVAATGLIQAFGAMGPVTIGGNVVGGDQPNSGLRAGGTLGPVTILGNVQGGAGADSASIIGNLGVKGLTVGTAAVPRSVIGVGPGSASVWALDGNIGPVKISGDLLGGPGIGSAAIRAVNVSGKGGKIGPVTVTGDVTGMAADSAAIRADAGIGPVRVGGLTGAATNSGRVFSGGAIAKVTVDRALTGGPGDNSGSVIAVGSILSVSIGNGVTGGDGRHSGSIQAGKDNAGPKAASLGPVKIGGDLTGGIGDYSASIQAYATDLGTGKLVGGRIAGVTVVGDVTGGTGKYSASLYAQDRIGPIKIGTTTGAGGLVGGSGRGSASITSTGAGIAVVTVYGDVTGGSSDYTAAIDAKGKLGPVSIRANATETGNLTGGGGKLSAGIRGLSIAKVTVAGSVAGNSGVNGASIVADRTLGLVSVGGSWTGASIAAGVDAGADGFFGTGDDTRSFAGVIAGITIIGTARGSVGIGDHFAFVAGHVKSLKINGTAVALTPGAGNDTAPTDLEPPPPTPPTGDFTVVELP